MQRVRNAVDRGKPVPETLRNRPRLRPDNEETYRAFWDLNSCRPVTMGGFGRIPWTAVADYAERVGIQDLDEFYYLVQAMDNVLMDHERKKASSGG